MKIEELKQKFTGKKIAVTESIRSYNGVDYTICDVDEQDSNYLEISSAVAGMGLILRVILPDTACTADYRIDRINVGMIKSDEVYVINYIDIG